MSLKDKINADLKTAMLNKDAVRLETIRSIRSEILKMDKSGMDREMTEEEEVQLVTRQAKLRKEAIEQYQAAGRTDLVEKEQAQLNIINEYLPAQLTEEEAEVIIDNVIKDTGATSQKDFGKVMGAAMKVLKGKVEGNVIQNIVKRKLENA
jgi:uncharacterized protein YqeY